MRTPHRRNGAKIMSVRANELREDIAGEPAVRQVHAKWPPSDELGVWNCFEARQRSAAIPGR